MGAHHQPHQRISGSHQNDYMSTELSTTPMCAAFRMTPIVALEIKISIPPIKHLLDLE